MITRYNHLSTDELLSLVDAKRHHSPIIDELCTRLERETADAPIEEDDIECPVCEATLHVSYDSSDEKPFNLISP